MNRFLRLLEEARAEIEREGGLNGEPVPEEPPEPPSKNGCTIILEHLRTYYDPVFRVGDAIYSATLGRPVKRSETGGTVVMNKLTEAWDAPRAKGGNGPDRSKMPAFFLKWLPHAWADVLASLPDEEQAEQIIPAAANEFRDLVACAMASPQTFGVPAKDEEGRRITKQERRPLIGWCFLWYEKATRWESARVPVWIKNEGGMLKVAVSQRLFDYVGKGKGAPRTQRSFTTLAERYGVGTRGRAGGQRVVILSDDFVAELVAATVTGGFEEVTVEVDTP